MQPLAEAVIVAVEKREEFVDGKKKSGFQGEHVTVVKG